MDILCCGLSKMHFHCCFCHRLLPLFVIGLLAVMCQPQVRADEIVTDGGRTIQGQITYEDDDHLEMKTDDYGTLSYKKYQITKITRTSGIAPVAPAAGGNPADAAGGAANPFGNAPAGPTVGGSIGAVNPFAPGGEAAAAAPGAVPGVSGASIAPAAGNVNPFAPPAAAGAPGMAGAVPGAPGAPGAPAAGNVNPFAPVGDASAFAAGGPPGAANPGFGQPGQPQAGAPGAFGQPANESVAIPGAAAPGGQGGPPAIPKFDSASLHAPPAEPEPEIPPGFDGVIFGLQESFEVQIQRTSQDAWERAGNETPVRIGYGIRTGLGKAKIKLRGRHGLRLPPNSQVILRELSQDNSKVTIEVLSGSVWSNVAPQARTLDFTVVTPDLTAGVRGTLFKTTVIQNEGSRVAVLESRVEVTSAIKKESVVVPQGMAAIVSPDGTVKPLVPVLPAEYDEWQAWEEWKLDFYKNVASFSAAGAPILMGMADQIAADNAQWASTVNDANRQIVANKFEDVLKYYADAFMKFARDTGHVPDPNTEGWQVLITNSGNWPEWKGPYITDTEVPPIDPWKRAIHYTVQYGRGQTANIHARIYSDGMNRRDDGGRPGSDDIIAFAMFYQIPNIASNPIYQRPPVGGVQNNRP